MLLFASPRVTVRKLLHLPPWAPWAAPVLARASLLAGSCLIDGQGPAPLRRPIKPSNRRIGLHGVRHLDKAKAPRTSGHTISHNLDPLHGAIGGKELLDVAFGGLPIYIADKDIHPSVLMLRWVVMVL